MKKVIVISDLSAYGKCSISVALPILSAMKVTAIPVPTCVLPTHTGGFLDISKLHLTVFLRNAIKSFKSNDITANCIYTGYISDIEQFSEISTFFHMYRDAAKVVDPIMADNGKFYNGMNEKTIEGYLNLIRQGVDLITPNITESRLMLGLDGEEEPMEEEFVKDMLKRLVRMGTKSVLITSVLLKDGFYYNFFYDSKSLDPFKKVKFNYKKGYYPGSGDIFASVVVGSIVKGEHLEAAVKKASSFVEKSIDKTVSLNHVLRDGLFFEYFLDEI